MIVNFPNRHRNDRELLKTHLRNLKLQGKGVSKEVCKEISRQTGFPVSALDALLKGSKNS